LVRFRFYKPETEKTESNLNRKKLSQTGKKPSNAEKTYPNRKKSSQTSLNRFCLERTKPNRTETGRFELVSVRFQFFLKKKIRFDYFFFIKTKPNRNNHTYN
jgi:hypothetical protein